MWIMICWLEILLLLKFVRMQMKKLIQNLRNNGRVKVIHNHDIHFEDSLATLYSPNAPGHPLVCLAFL